MARRSEHSAEELRELAIHHAFVLIEETGEAGFKAREIARKMGYTVGTIYYLFGSMEQLRYHVCAKIIDHFNSTAREEMRRRKDTVNLQVSLYIRFSQEFRNHWEFIFAPRLNTNRTESPPDWYLKKIEESYLLFAQPFFQLIENRQTARKAVTTLLASIHGICLYSLHGKLTLLEGKDAEGMAKHLVKTYLSGLKCR